MFILQIMNFINISVVNHLGIEQIHLINLLTEILKPSSSIYFSAEEATLLVWTGGVFSHKEWYTLHATLVGRYFDCTEKRSTKVKILEVLNLFLNNLGDTFHGFDKNFPRNTDIRMHGLYKEECITL